ncbi:PhzF family phenazine biosynthesis protein [Desertihabitans brevis]|uniref:PhzF family phenazine biosynthesis protein n=1 Tax=Desertihabitans brevis TaxID=2268447 RepID=UPI0022798AF1|nr:PhzF family phenazine biosynthesis protein [Desertihabitans brevis]
MAGLRDTGQGCRLEVRAFLVHEGVLVEDPVTGSLNAGLGQWLTGTGVLPGRYVAAQGTVLGRAGRVHVERDGADVRVGGRAEVLISGTVAL